MSYYRAKASGDMPLVATHIANDLFEPWFNSVEYADSRSQFQDEVLGQSDPLKFEITKYLKTLSLPAAGPKRKEIEAFSQVHIQAVLTTNWDETLEGALPDLEGALPDFETFVGHELSMWCSRRRMRTASRYNKWAPRRAE
jgi:hypothetical protein